MMKTPRNFLVHVLVLAVCLCMAAPAGAELIQHLDATVEGSVVTDAAGVVTQWSDQSGSGNNATPDKGSVMYPSISLSASGAAGLDFGATRNTLELFSSAASDTWLNQSAGTGGFAVLIAFKADSLVSNWNDLIGNSSAVGSGFGMRYSSGGTMKAYLDGTIQKNSALEVAAGDTMVMAFNYDAPTGAYEF